MEVWRSFVLGEKLVFLHPVDIVVDSTCVTRKLEIVGMAISIVHCRFYRRERADD